MALDFGFNTDANSDSGTALSAAHARIQVILQTNQTTLQIRIDMFETEQAFLDGRKSVWIDEIPYELRVFESDVTTLQYANVDMEQIHNQIRDMLLEGSTHAQYPPGADPAWLGLEGIDPLNTVTTNMP